MPMMRSLRTFRLATTSGHVVLFEADTPIYVPDAAVVDAMTSGCVPVNESDIPFYEDMNKTRVEFQGDVRRSTIYLAIEAIVKNNNAKDFDGSGTPRSAVVSERVGFAVPGGEVRAAYEQYLAAKVSGEDYVVHPQAANILRVVGATSKEELALLAEEMGVDMKKAKGMQGQELRKMLLVKFNGAVG